MVKYALKVQAELSNVTSVEPSDSPESPFEYTFTIECTKCREKHGKPVTINRFENHDITGSRGEASFVFRCKVCKSEHSASIERTNETLQQGSAQFLTIDARGIEFLEFIPDGHFQCQGAESNARFTEIDLSEGEWYDYDDDASQEVSITDVVWTIDRI